MLRATLDQMRSSAGRLAAAGIAILLGTAFVAASLLASATMRQATYDSFTASYADADLVVSANDTPLTSDAVDAIRETDGVTAADVAAYLGLQVTGTRATEFIGASSTPSDPSLAVGTIDDGTEATSDDEIVLSTAVADRIGAGIGDDVRIEWQTVDGQPVSATVTVVGLLAETGSFFTNGDDSRVAPSLYESMLEDQSPDGTFYGSVLLNLDDGADVGDVRAALEADAALDGAQIQTITEIAESMSAELTGSTVAFLTLMLAFAAVALAVASLVITNTFQVLVAQRTKTLALLRCVGASRGQIRRSVLLEAALLGLLSSLAGLALGSVVVIGGVRVLGDVFPAAAVGTAVPFDWWVPVTTIGIGVVVTLLAALVPARMATRVAPVAALRPIEGASEQRAGRIRLVFSAGLAVIGLLMLGGGVAVAFSAAGTDNAEVGVLGGLALGVLGGLSSLVGLLVGSVFLVPRLLPLLGRAAGRGVPAQIATANAVRNPRRTAATTNALVIGVALVVMMSTGALSARQTLLGALDNEFTVDVAATSTDETQAVAPAQVDAVEQTDGVGDVVTVRSTTQIAFTGDDGNMAYPTTVAFADGDPADVLRDPSFLPEITDGVLLVGDSESIYGSIFADGSTVTVTAPDGTGTDETLRVVHADLGDPYTAYVSAATMAQIAPDLPVNGIWARFADGVNADDAATSVQQSLNEVTTADPEAPLLSVAGSAVERAAYGQVIDTMLAIVLGLLAVAVVIALVGVANTLSLSVIERRRENATLRAIGLTRGQLRGMLAVEGVLIAVVGSIVGVIAGLVYGWAGAAVVLGGIGGGEGLALGVPWLQLLAVAVIAVVAGLLASVLPARSAVRQSPVAALATD